MNWTEKYAVLTVVALLFAAFALGLNLKATSREPIVRMFRRLSLWGVFSALCLAGVGLVLLAVEVLL